MGARGRLILGAVASALGLLALFALGLLPLTPQTAVLAVFLWLMATGVAYIVDRQGRGGD